MRHEYTGEAMFEYFGKKKNIAYKYPTPTHDLLIEPFCGAAYFALLHWDREVWLNDKNPVISEIWRYLQKSDPEGILRLPLPRPGQPIAEVPSLPQVERDLIGFVVSPSNSSPRLSVPTLDHEWFSAGRWRGRIRYIAHNLHKIRRWTITNLDYLELPCGLRASWFVDAPYQHAGRSYPYRIGYYAVLGEWCRNLRGQAIVCEDDLADWLPFRVLDPSQPCNRFYRGNAIECYWTNET